MTFVLLAVVLVLGVLAFAAGYALVGRPLAALRAPQIRSGNRTPSPAEEWIVTAADVAAILPADVAAAIASGGGEPVRVVIHTGDTFHNLAGRYPPHIAEVAWRHANQFGGVAAVDHVLVIHPFTR